MVEYIIIPMSKKKLRQKCHYVFDKIWQSGLMERERTYIWLASTMNIPLEDCHFSRMKWKQMVLAMDYCITFLNAHYTSHDYPKYLIL